MQPLMRSRLSSIAIAIGSLFPFQISPALAGIDNHTPTSGQTVTGDTSPPNPDTIGVAAVPGSTNVTVNILTEAGISAEISVIGINAIFVRDQSAVMNDGAITVAGDTFDAIRFDSNNIITNSGTITPQDCYRKECCLTGARTTRC